MMKKITLLVAIVLMALSANAQVLNNPKDANGYYIVKWDCAGDKWATSNNFEVDEAFTFAIDVTGTALEDWIKEGPTNAGGTRSIAVNRWTGFGDFNGDVNRLKQIKGNIYGTTWCFTQIAASFDVAAATTLGEVTYFMAQVFGFEYTPDAAGALWWQWPAGWLAEGATVDGVDGNMFTSAPYTGTKTSAEFYCDDYEGFWTYTAAGYAPSCAVIPSVTGIAPVNVIADVVGHEYYNLQGIKLNKEPESGLFIKTAILSNGDRVSTKLIKPLK
ncbi:MAG: hypothetical protein LBO74_08415 [Candidatus Symbiothrix sp.]|jgi:hypothetical protein|nr:hypothetical protein [Candidatus Symbiothrix sp.]